MPTSEPISGLPAAAALTGTEPLAIVQGGITVQATPDDIKALIAASPVMQFKGQADASAVDEAAATGTSTFQTGDVYRINVAAAAPHAFSDISEDLLIGDWVVFNGTIFQKQDGTDPTAVETKTAYESNADTNAFTDVEQTKLSGIETFADVTDTENVNAAGAVLETDYASGPFDVTNASFDSKSFSVVGQGNNHLDVFFKPDGTTMFTVEGSTDQVKQYTLSVAWDVSTATFANKTLNVAPEDGSMTGFFFRNDGLRVFIVGVLTDKVYQYSLTTPWDISTASFDNKSFSVATEDADARSVSLKDDGTKMFIIGRSTNSIFQYTLSTPFDVSTASFDIKSFSFASEETDVRGFFFGDSGSKMFIVGTVNDKVFQYSLTTPFDVSTASFDSISFSFSAQDGVVEGIFFRPDGDRFFLMGVINSKVFQYSITTNQTILLDITGAGTPLTLDLNASTFVGRKATGDAGTLTPAEARTVLNVEDGAAADQTDAEIKTAYENNANTNEFSDAEQTKLTGIETLADVTDATNVAAAGAGMLNTAQEWTATQNFNATTLTDGPTINWNLAANQVTSVTLAGNRTIAAPTNQVDGATYIISLIQDGTGSRTVTWNSVFKFPNGTLPVLSTVAGDKDFITFISDGTNMFAGTHLVIGADVQAFDAGLDSIAGLTTAADKMIFTTALDTYSVADLTAAGRAILDDVDASAQRTTLGVATTDDVLFNTLTATNNIVASADLIINGSLIMAIPTSTPLIPAGMHVPSVFEVAFITNSLERMRIDDIGNILIGTASGTGAKLEVDGTAQFKGFTSTAVSLVNINGTAPFTAQGTGAQVVLKGRAAGNPIFQEWRTFDNIRRGFFGYSTSSSDNMLWDNETAGGSIAIATNNLTRMTILSDGKVGIGVVPTFPLDVAGDTFIDGTLQVTGDIAGGRFLTSDSILAAGSVTAASLSVSGNVALNAVSSTPAILAGMHMPVANQLALITNGVERARIDDSGNVGIGKTPTVPLDVVGAITSSTTITAGNNLVGDVFQIASSTSTPAIVAGIHAPASFTLGLITNSAERMRISSTGNVGIGTENPVANTTAGVKQLALADATTVPTGTVTGAGILYMDNGQLHNLDAAGTDHNLAANSTLFISTADVVVANSTTETSIIGAGVGTMLIPAAKLKAGTKFKFRAQGIISDTGNPTFQIRGKLGGVTIADSGANTLGSITNDHWVLDLEMVIRTEGVSGTAMISGGFLTSKNDHFALVNTSTFSIDTTVDQLWDVSVEWGAADAANTVTAQIVELHEINV